MIHNLNFQNMTRFSTKFMTKSPQSIGDCLKKMTPSPEIISPRASKKKNNMKNSKLISQGLLRMLKQLILNMRDQTSQNQGHCCLWQRLMTPDQIRLTIKRLGLITENLKLITTRQGLIKENINIMLRTDL